MRFSFLTITFLLLSIEGFSQRDCASADYAARTAGSVHLSATPSLYSRDTIANEIITIPVVIHVVYHTATENISDAQIKSQLKVLNEDFRRMNADAANTPQAFQNNAADCRIMFCLAQVDPHGRPNPGIIRKFTNKTYFDVDDAVKFSAAGGDDAWDSRKYLNIWICKMSGSVVGYASVPGSQADKDGVVIQYDAFGTTGVLRPDYNKGRTTTHELGHWMGLKHIWGDNLCGDDGIQDTPTQSNYNTGCPSFPHLSACSPNNNGDMYMNYMDYTSDVCMNMFTVGQKIKMRGLFAINGVKNSFMSSFACDSTLASAAPLPADSQAVATPSVAAPELKVFPNPVQSQFGFTVKGDYTLTGKQVVVMNETGMVLMKQTFSSNEDKVSISRLPAGVYIVSVGQGKDKKVIKLIKY